MKSISIKCEEKGKILFAVKVLCTFSLKQHHMLPEGLSSNGLGDRLRNAVFRPDQANVFILLLMENLALKKD